LKAVVIDEWSVLRGGVAAVLGQCGVVTALQASTAMEAVTTIEQALVDLAVLGSVPDVAPAPAIARLRAVRPGMRILVLLKNADRDETIQALDAGADAVLARTASEMDLREATVRLTLGQRYVSPQLLAAAFDHSGARTERDRFTDRERDVLAVLVEGFSNREIADKLFIGEATVKTHLRNIYDKLGVSNRAQAVGRVMQDKMLR